MIGHGYARIKLCGQTTTFKIDTGAEVTAISTKTYDDLGRITLNTPDRKLLGPSTQPLEVLGSFNGQREELSSNHLCHQGTQKQPTRTASYHRSKPSLQTAHIADPRYITQQFPNLFTVLGNLGEEFEIKLTPDAKPFALSTPRNIALPLRLKVKQELLRMEAMGVISKVDEPTPWCAGMIVVPKKSGEVRICVDLKPLNKSVLREVYPLLKVDETLAQLSGAKVFTKLDANSGFWQIPLSRLLTTFITPMGRYCFNKLPFGISSAPEHFQKRMSAILSGLEGVVVQMDDILVFGKDQAEHDGRLFNVLVRISVAGGTLNRVKCGHMPSVVGT